MLNEVKAEIKELFQRRQNDEKVEEKSTFFHPKPIKKQFPRVLATLPAQEVEIPFDKVQPFLFQNHINGVRVSALRLIDDDRSQPSASGTTSGTPIELPMATNPGKST